MSKAKIVVYLALIFVAGAVAGGAIVLSSPQTFSRERPSRPRFTPEEFANHLWDRMQERLNLSDEQKKQVEPIFRAGFDEVRKIQDKSLEEVEAAIRQNHAEMGKLLNDEQRDELDRMNKERQDFLKHRGHRPPPPGPGPMVMPKAPQPTNE